VVEASREATPADLRRIVELARVARDEQAAMRGGDLWLAREAWPEPLDEAYRTLLTRDDARVVVGTIDDTILGYGAVLVDTLRSGARLGVITDLFVEEEARAVGIGEAMVNALVDHCRAHDCIGIDASALPGHRATKNFFETHGFTARALVMHRRLDVGG